MTTSNLNNQQNVNNSSVVLAAQPSEIGVISTSNLLGRSINVYGTIENPFFLAKDVADWLELTNVSDMISRVDEDERSKFNLGRQGETWFLSEDGLYETLLQSRKPIAKQFKKGVKDILKQIRRTGSFNSSAQSMTNQLSMKDKMNAATWAAKFLNLNDASKLLMAQQILAPTGLILPEYTSSKGFLLSADKLLKNHGVGMTSHAFNLAMEDKELVTYRERPSKSKGIKRFPILTNKGLKYGENQVHPKCQQQTQIRYYEDKFIDLLKELNLK